MSTKIILVVDDEPSSLKVLVAYLERTEENYDIIQAMDGETCLRIASEKDPDLIIIDWVMPGISGIEVINRLKSNKKTENIPVIICTGFMTSSEDLSTAFQARAIDYLRKPYDMIELIARVRSVISLADSYKKIRIQRDELKKKNEELELAQSRIQTLSGLLPICASCKKIRDDKGYWQEVEDYIGASTKVEFSHGICPGCKKEMFPDFLEHKKIDDGNSKPFLCASCGRIKDDKGNWQDTENHIPDSEMSEFIHGICPDCLREIYPDLPKHK